MSGRRDVVLALVACVAVVSVAVAQDQEKKVERKDLPPAVEKTVAAQSRGATIKDFSQETEDGKTTYEVAMTFHGHAKDVIINADGTVAAIEEEVAFAKLSAAVKAGLTAKAAGGKITLVESITKQGKLVAYEAQVTAADGKKSEVQVGPDGKPLAHEE